MGQRKNPLPHVKNAGGGELRSAARAPSGGDSSGGDQGDDDEAQQHAVDEEGRELVGGHEAQQPGNGRVGDNAGDDGRDNGGRPAHGVADGAGLRCGLQQSGRDQGWDSHVEGQARGRHSVELEEQASGDRRPGAGDAGEYRGQGLECADDEGVLDGHVLHALAEVLLVVGQPHGPRPDDEGPGDHPQGADRPLDEVLEQQSDGGHRDRSQDDAPAERVVRVLAGVLVAQSPEPGGDDADDVGPEVDDGGDDRTDLDDGGEGGHACGVDLVAEELLDDVEVAGGGHREELGDALDDAEEDGVQPVQRDSWGGWIVDSRQVTGARGGETAGSLWYPPQRWRFSRAATPGQRPNSAAAYQFVSLL